MDDKLFKDDRYLIEACLKKDLKAWSNFISKYSRLVYISIDNRLKKCGITLFSHDIEDIRQDVFTTIWREEKLKSIINTDDISYWIAILSGNAAISHIRKNESKERLKTVSINEKFQEKEFADIIPSKALKPEDDTAEIEMAKIIDEAIRRLPSCEKMIIKLYLIHGKKYHEIADITDLPKGTVSNYIKRAKEKLRYYLKDI